MSDLEIEQFTRIPFEVDAVRVTEDNMEKLAEWCQGDVRTVNTGQGDEKYVKVRVHRALTERQTQAFVGDWVLYAGTGFKVYTEKAFEKSFQKAGTLQHGAEYSELSIAEAQAAFAASQDS